MAKGDVPVTFTIPRDIDKKLNKMAERKGVFRRDIIIEAVKLLAKSEAAAKAVK